MEAVTDLVTTLTELINDTIEPESTAERANKIEVGTVFVIGFVGIVGNSLVLIVLLFNKSFRKRVCNILVIDQSMVDFLTSLSFVVTYASQSVEKSYAGSQIWICKLLDGETLMWTFMSISTCNLMAITLERYLMVVHPVLYRNTMTVKKVLILIAITWLYAAASVLFFMIPYTDEVHGVCVMQVLMPQKLALFYAAYYLVFYFLLPVAMFLICYGHMLWVMKTRIRVKPKKKTNTDLSNEDQQKQQKMSRTQMNLTKVMFMVSLCFIICWGPVCVHYLLVFMNVLTSVNVTGPLYRGLAYLSFTNSVINPFVYAFKYDDFRKGFRKMFGLKRQETEASTIGGTTLNP